MTLSILLSRQVLNEYLWVEWVEFIGIFSSGFGLKFWPISPNLYSFSWTTRVGCVEMCARCMAVWQRAVVPWAREPCTRHGFSLRWGFSLFKYQPRVKVANTYGIPFRGGSSWERGVATTPPNFFWIFFSSTATATLTVTFFSRHPHTAQFLHHPH